MDLHIDEAKLAAAAGAAVESAVTLALNSHELRQAVREAAQATLAEVDFPRLLSDAVRRHLREQAPVTVEEIARRLAPLFAVAAEAAAIDSMVEMLVGVEARGHYLSENERADLKRAARARLSAEP